MAAVAHARSSRSSVSKATSILRMFSGSPATRRWYLAATSVRSAQSSRAFFSKTNPHGSPVTRQGDAFDISTLAKLLEIIGKIGTAIGSAIHELTNRKLVIANRQEKHGMGRTNLLNSLPRHLGLQKCRKAPVRAFQRSREFEVGNNGCVSGAPHSLGSLLLAHVLFHRAGFNNVLQQI